MNDARKKNYIVNTVYRSFLLVCVLSMVSATLGGLIDNVPRMLPNNLDAVILRETWKVPPYFQLLQKAPLLFPL